MLADHLLECGDRALHEEVRLANARFPVKCFHHRDGRPEERHDKASIAAAGAEAAGLRLEDRNVETGLGRFEMEGGQEPV